MTGKYWLGERVGLTASVGTSVVFNEARLGFEDVLHTWGTGWSWAQVPLYLDVGASAGVGSLTLTGVRVGVDGGVGVGLQFAKVPVEVYTNAGLAVYPLNSYCSSRYAAAGLPGVEALCFVGVRATAGVRYYF